MNFNSITEINEYALNLKGAVLAKTAKDLDIPGRSKMHAEELREAIGNLLKDVWIAERDDQDVKLRSALANSAAGNVEYLGDFIQYADDVIDDDSPDESAVETPVRRTVGSTLNRSQRRALKHAQRKRNDGLPRFAGRKAK